MGLKFITGNKNKYIEMVAMLSPFEVEQVEMDLDEIQELDPQKVVEHKLKEALKHTKGPCFIEDQGLVLECLQNKLPGPFIKWFEKGIGNDGIIKLVEQAGNSKAIVYSILGFADEKGGMQFFEGRQEGNIVQARGDQDFGWGPIFQPDGYNFTYGEMEREMKYSVSMRALAVKNLKEYLEKES